MRGDSLTDWLSDGGLRRKTGTRWRTTRGGGCAPSSSSTRCCGRTPSGGPTSATTASCGPSTTTAPTSSRRARPPSPLLPPLPPHCSPSHTTYTHTTGTDHALLLYLPLLLRSAAARPCLAPLCAQRAGLHCCTGTCPSGRHQWQWQSAHVSLSIVHRRAFQCAPCAGAGRSGGDSRAHAVQGHLLPHLGGALLGEGAPSAARCTSHSALHVSFLKPCAPAGTSTTHTFCSPEALHFLCSRVASLWGSCAGSRVLRRRHRALRSP